MRVGEVRVVRRTDRFSEARRFYCDVLGWPLTKEWTAEGDNPDGFIVAAGANARFEFLADPHTGQAPGVGLSVQVDDIDTVARVIRQAGHQVTDPATMPWGHRSATTTDPTGQALTFFQVLEP